MLSVKPPSAFSQASHDIQTRKHEQMSRDHRLSQGNVGTITNQLSSNFARKSESRQALNSFNTSVERLNLRGPLQAAREENNADQKYRNSYYPRSSQGEYMRL